MKCRCPGPIPDLLIRNLHFSKTSKGVICTSRLEKAALHITFQLPWRPVRPLTLKMEKLRAGRKRSCSRCLLRTQGSPRPCPPTIPAIVCHVRGLSWGVHRSPGVAAWVGLASHRGGRAVSLPPSSHSQYLVRTVGSAAAPGRMETPDAHTGSCTHMQSHKGARARPPPMRTPIHWAPQRQERYRPRQPLFDCRIGLGRGSPFSGCVRRCSVGGTQTGPQSDNKLGGRFSDSSLAGVRAGSHVGPPGPCRLPGSGVPRRG